MEQVHAGSARLDPNTCESWTWRCCSQDTAGITTLHDPNLLNAMKSYASQTAHADEASSAKNVDFVDVLIILARHKKLIVGLPILAAVLSAAVSLILPSTYVASTKLLPPQQAQSSAAALLSQLGGVAGAMAGTAGLKNPSDIYVGMLKSRRIEDNLVNRFSLKAVYKADLQEKARQRLESNTVITAGKDGFINIEVEDSDKKRVAQLANAYVEELIHLSSGFAITEAAQRRSFYEHQLELAKNKLAEAEVDLKGAIDRHGVISVDSDSRAVVETIARLRAQISAKEIQLNSLGAFVTETNVEYIRAQQELTSLRTELSRLENGQPGKVSGSNSDSGNNRGLESVRLLREVKYRQMLYELLAKQYEVARLDEAKDPSSIQILDAATEPERRAKPKRAFIVIAATLASFLLSVIGAFLTEARLCASQEKQKKWNELRALLSRPKTDTTL